MIYKLEAQRLDWEGALECVETNYVQTHYIERIEHRGVGEWFIYFKGHGLTVHQDDPGMKELLEWFDSVAYPKNQIAEQKSDVPF